MISGSYVSGDFTLYKQVAGISILIDENARNHIIYFYLSL